MSIINPDNSDSKIVVDFKPWKSYKYSQFIICKSVRVSHIKLRECGATKAGRTCSVDALSL